MTLVRGAGAWSLLVYILELMTRDLYIYLRDHERSVIRKVNWTLSCTRIVCLFSVEHLVQLLIFVSTIPSRSHSCTEWHDSANLRIVGLTTHRARTAVLLRPDIQDSCIAYQVTVRLSLWLVVRVPHRRKHNSGVLDVLLHELHVLEHGWKLLNIDAWFE